MTANETASDPQKNTDPEHTVPPLARRIRGVLLEPVKTFRELDPSWGLLGPWLIVMAAGLIYAVVAIAQVDFAQLAEQRTAYSNTFLSAQTQRAMKQVEQSYSPGKLGSGFAKLFLLGGPTVGSILGIVLVGLILFAGAAAFGGKRDLLRAIVVAAHAKLVALVLYGALFVGTILGNPTPATDLHNVADEVANPILAVFLSLVDPIAIWHTALLTIGLVVALGVKPARAVLVTVALHLLPWLLLLGGAAMSLQGRQS